LLAYEYTKGYFDPSTFMNGETKRALLRAKKKQDGKGMVGGEDVGYKKRNKKSKG
jgi:hypothetical protein